VGRIPARSVDQVAAVVQRSLAHRAVAATNRSALYLSDDNDASFRSLAETVRTALPAGIESQALHLLDYNAAYPLPDPAPPQWEEPGVLAIRADIRAALLAGVRLVQFFGHGDLNHVAGEGLWVQGTELNNVSEMLVHGGLPPIFVIHDCMSGWLGAPNPPHSVSESMVLLTDPARGAAAVISPAAHSYEPLMLLHGLALQAALTSAERPTLGEAVVAAAHETLSSTQCTYAECRILVMASNLLGDPTLPSLADATGN